MGLFERVIVVVGDPERDADLIRYARVLPRLSPAVECHFVHILAWANRVRSGETHTTHEQALAHLQRAVGDHYGGEGAICSVLTGDRVDRLLETVVESAADLILLQHATEHTGRRDLARRLAMKAPCSVWMRPEGSDSEVRRVLAAVDYSEPSAYALSLAAQVAARVGNSHCLALHVYFDESAAGSDEAEVTRRAGEEAFQRFTGPLATGGLPIRPLFENNSNICHAVESVASRTGANLLVMGSRGHSRSASVLLGSESDHMLMESRIPVLIAKRRGEGIGLLQALLDRDFHRQNPPRFG